MEADIEPLTQDPTLLLTTMAGQAPPPLTEAIHLQLPLEAHQGLPYAYKDGFQASPDLARTIQVRFSSVKFFQKLSFGASNIQVKFERANFQMRVQIPRQYLYK